MRKLRKAIPLALAMSVALTMTPIRASAEEPTQVQAEQSDLVEENESLSDEADKDKEGYKLVFNDEFNGNQLDRTVWNVEKHEKGWVNGELQEYVDSDENIKVQDGCLNIIPVEKVETTSTLMDRICCQTLISVPVRPVGLKQLQTGEVMVVTHLRRALLLMGLLLIRLPILVMTYGMYNLNKLLSWQQKALHIKLQSKIGCCSYN